MNKTVSKQGVDDKTKTGRSRQTRPVEPDPDRQPPRQVFIDLDDAYGVPFSAEKVSPQEYRA